MARWFPLHCHSHFSLLDGLSKPEQIAERLLECGHEGSALTDHGTLAGVPSFLRALAGAKLRGVAGCEFYLCRGDPKVRTRENASLSHLCVLAATQDGWSRMVAASSAAHSPEHFYRKPRLDLDSLAAFAGGQWVVFSGHMGSDLADVFFEEPRLAYRARDEAEAKSLVRRGWQTHVWALIERYQALFGRENFYVEIQLVDRDNLPAAAVVAEGLRWAARKRGVPCVATADSHYPRREDAPDQRVLLCAALNTTLPQVQRRLDTEEDVGLGGFFRSSNYHIPTAEEMAALHTEEELANSLRIAARCQTPSLSRQPLLPRFVCPEGRTPEAHLEALCEEGFARKIVGRVPDAELPRYRAELRRQLAVLRAARLSSYFLIVEDYTRFARSQGWPVGEGRGSAAGCLPSYLLDVTDVDPVAHGLVFERFYVPSRNIPEHVSFHEHPFSA